MRGVSGHQHNPFAGKTLFQAVGAEVADCCIFAVVTVGTPSETHGEVKAFSLVYSGNFLVEAELNETGRLRVNMGLNPMGLQWHLKPGETCE